MGAHHGHQHLRGIQVCTEIKPGAMEDGELDGELDKELDEELDKELDGERTISGIRYLNFKLLKNI